MKKCACRGSFLERFVQPAILMLLNNEPLHGFSIYKKLIDSDIVDYSGIDPTGLYRTLKKMEDAGILISEWDIENIAQAKRVYRITADGKECLKHWQKTLFSYKENIDRLAKAVSRSIEINGG